MSKKLWTTEGFEAFRRGTFGNAGHNLYVSKKGVLQRIFQYDLDRNGYVDLVFANCQNHSESPESYVYNPDGTSDALLNQGSISGMVLDIDGDGYQDIVIAGHYDMVSPYASTDIYYGSPEGYSEKYHVRIPTPWAFDCCAGDFKGTGKKTLAFSLGQYGTIRLFEQTELGLEWNGFTDLPIDAKLITAADLDGDGYDDLIVRQSEKVTATTVYWGGEDGINLERKSVLHELSEKEILMAEDAPKFKSEMEQIYDAPRQIQTVRWNGRECFTLSTGKKVIFFSGNKDRQIERVLDVEVPLALAVAVGDIDGDGYDDIAVAATANNEKNPQLQSSFIIWNGKDGLDSRPRTVIATKGACDVDVLDGHVLFCQCEANRSFTNDCLLFTYPDFENPKKYVGEDARRCALIKNPDGALRVFLNNHYSRSSIGYDECFVYWGDKDGYSPDRMLRVPGHCAVDAMIADFDDDGWAELMIGNNSENSTFLDVGHHVHHFGPNGFEPEKTYTIPTNLGWGSVCADFNRDGYLEIVTVAEKWGHLRMYSAKDNFQTWETIELPEGSSVRWPAAVDLNNDGWLDIIAGGGKAKTMILWGGPDGFSKERSQTLSTLMPIRVTAADLTKNGYADLIVGCHTETPVKGDVSHRQPHHSFMHIYWNGPEGISETRKSMIRGDAADSFAIADFNGDGWLDIFSGSYHGGKDRDVNSFLFWNREGKFRELDREHLFTHSASGCMAADFNEDGFIDLAVANHKVFGDHHGYSTVWWNSEDGFNPKNCTNLPSEGPHGMISAEIGDIMNRSFSEYYYSEEYAVEADAASVTASVTADIPEKTAVNVTLRVNGGEWMDAKDITVKKGDKLQYRLELYAFNGLRTPRVEKVTVELN